MPTEFCFSLDDRPGSLASIAAALAKAGVKIEGGAGLHSQGKGLISIVTTDSKGAHDALDDAGLNYVSQEVIMVHVGQKPQALSQLTKAFADAGINLTSFYITMHGHQVFGADDIESAKKIAADLGVLD